ncbi:MAG: hypothetical protein R3F30_04305 [Planctomycetota bacterium]
MGGKGARRPGARGGVLPWILTTWFGVLAGYLLLFELGPALAAHREARAILGRRLEAHDRLEQEVVELRRRLAGLEHDPQAVLLELDRRSLLGPVQAGEGSGSAAHATRADERDPRTGRGSGNRALR